jgi:protein-disulfide isomerase
MSDSRERQNRREERLPEETKADPGGRRTRLLRLAAGAAFLALAAVVVLIVVNASSTSGGDAENLEGAAAVEAELGGIPQQGLVLGDPAAKVELIEYGDLQCPACKSYAEEILPPVIENQVENGQAKLVFRNFTILGAQSETAGAAALAAGAQGRGWNYVELFYRNQGVENTDYADDEFLTAIARAAGVRNLAKWQRDRKSRRFTDQVSATSAQAESLGLTGTPSFAIKGPSSEGVELLSTPGSADELESAIEAAR